MVEPAKPTVEVLQKRKTMLLKKILIPSGFSLRASYALTLIPDLRQKNCRCQKGFKHVDRFSILCSVCGVARLENFCSKLLKRGALGARRYRTA